MCVFRLLLILLLFLFSFPFLELPQLFKLYTSKIYNNNRYTCNQNVINHQTKNMPSSFSHLIRISCYENAHTHQHHHRHMIRLLLLFFAFDSIQRKWKISWKCLTSVFELFSPALFHAKLHSSRKNEWIFKHSLKGLRKLGKRLKNSVFLAPVWRSRLSVIIWKRTRLERRQVSKNHNLLAVYS